MAIIWEHSLQPWIDINGDPYGGLKAYFYDAGTTTPRITYKDGALSNPHDHPVVADSAGQFPAIYLPSQITYRVRVLLADGSTLLDVDNISAPATVVPDPPSGTTPAQYLYQTGDLKFKWQTNAPTGYVRCNGRTIGAAPSGATERANDDCQALFIHLWDNDSRLVVSGGRGASSAGDWAANKNIALPDLRGYLLAGLLGMGNGITALIPPDMFTGGQTGDVLGDKTGTAKHTLTGGQMPSHTHSGGTDSAGGVTVTGLPNQPVGATGGPGNVVGQLGSFNIPAHSHTFTTNSSGGGEAHPNVQPSAFVPIFIKL